MNKMFSEIISKHMLPDNNSVAISIELDGKPVLKHYSGVNENTTFDVGSLAKQFTACCIAILACEKRINLNASIRVYLPEMNEYADKITLKHLLSMTSGTRQIYCLKHMQSSSPLSEMELFFRQEQPAFNAGDFSGYSNTCYTLLGHIVERVTGGINKFAEQRIFEPLGMKNTQGYGIMGDGGLLTTANDLAKWHNCLINRILPAAPDRLFELLFTPFTLNDGELCPYNFGFIYDEYNRGIIWHHGDVNEWQCVMRVYLKEKLSISVLMNGKNVNPVELALDLENEFFNDLPEQTNYKSNYYNRPKTAFKVKKVKHNNFPNAEKQFPFNNTNYDKYLGQYYCYELDTYFDIFPDGNCFNMKYTGKDNDGYINLIDFSNKDRLKARTQGDWGRDYLSIDFYGNEYEINFFTLEEGMGHFYFVKCAKQV